MAVLNKQLTNIPKNVSWLAGASHLPAQWARIFVWNNKRHQCFLELTFKSAVVLPVRAAHQKRYYLHFTDEVTTTQRA